MSTYILTGDIALLHKMKDELVANGYREIESEIGDKIYIITTHKWLFFHKQSYLNFKNREWHTLTPSNYEGIKQKIINDE